LVSDKIREEHRLRVFENRALRRIFGPKRDEVTGGWRKLHNEKLRYLYFSSSIIKLKQSRWMRWAGNVARMGGKEIVQDFGGRVRKRSLEIPRRRWVDNIKMVLRKVGWGVIWIYVALDREQWKTLLNTVMNLRIPLNVGKLLSSCATGGFSRRAQLRGFSYI
jgi:hypothetical protein